MGDFLAPSHTFLWIRRQSHKKSKWNSIFYSLFMALYATAAAIVCCQFYISAAAACSPAFSRNASSSRTTLRLPCCYLAKLLFIWGFFFLFFFFALRLNLSILCYLCIAPIHQPTATTKTRAQHWAPQHIHTCKRKSLHITVYQYLFVCVCVREQVCMHMLVFT